LLSLTAAINIELTVEFDSSNIILFFRRDWLYHPPFSPAEGPETDLDLRSKGELWDVCIYIYIKGKHISEQEYFFQSTVSRLWYVFRGPLLGVRHKVAAALNDSCIRTTEALVTSSVRIT
jgi:hypothetical protein